MPHIQPKVAEKGTHMVHETASSDDSVRAIITTDVKVSPYEDVDKACYSAIYQELPCGYLDPSSHPPCWGNIEGLRKLEENTDLKDRLSRVENKLDSLAGMETRIDHLEARVAVLTLESHKFLEIRNRRMCTFRRDILQHVLARDSDTIPSGNNIAHDGDVLSNVKLYERGIRFDDDVFIKLYGLPYTRVKIYESERIVLQTLNVHSTIIAQKRTAEELAPFKASFSRFIQSIQDGGYRKFSNMPNAPETKAMEQFWSDYRELIKKNPWRMLNNLEDSQ